MAVVDNDYARVDNDEDQDDNSYAAMSHCKELHLVKPVIRKKLCKKSDRCSSVPFLILFSRICLQQKVLYLSIRTFHISEIPKVDIRSPASNAPDCS